jgi:HTH-type transcriptional regulator/antitoxin HigA
MPTHGTRDRIPGLYIRDALKAHGWSQRDLAFVLGVEEGSLNRIIKGKARISVAMSKALAMAFDVDGDFFANLQKAYDFAHVEEPDPEIARRAALQRVFPTREMINRAWIGSDNPELQLARFFKVANETAIPYVAAAAEKSDTGTEMPPLHYAWLCRVLQIAEQAPAKPYSQTALRQALPRLRALMREPQAVKDVPRILGACGVKYVIVEGLADEKIDGVCAWQGGFPVIGMSLRHDRINNFWFVLRHEIEHVLRRHGRNRPVVDSEVMERAETGVVSAQEKLANEAAADFCVPRKEMASFIAAKEPLFSERDIIGFARRMNVHPGIVVGQIQAHTKKHGFLGKYLVKVREFLLPAAIVDGWEQAALVGRVRRRIRRQT